MWSVLSNFFKKDSQDECPSAEDQACQPSSQANETVHVSDTMSRYTVEERRRAFEISSDQYSASGESSEHSSDSNDLSLAKQRASVKWLLTKSFNNRVPKDLQEPFYRDHEGQERLQPSIVNALANADLYCQALKHMYSDPNYCNQDHSGILKALTIKNVVVSETNSTPLTETTLRQNSPLKMSAHMAVIEGLMVLHAREVATAERVIEAIRRFDPGAGDLMRPQDTEKGLLMWISHSSSALIAKIQAEEPAEKSRQLPELPPAKDLQSLCSGAYAALAAVVAYYCPSELNWTDIRVPKKPSPVVDAQHNLGLVSAFCEKCVPYIFHMEIEDVNYLRGTMKQNLLVFLAELFNALEINPIKYVRYPGGDFAKNYLDECPRNSYGVAHKRSLPQAITPVIPDLRSNLSMSAPGFTVSKPLAQNTVKKSKSMHQTAESHIDDYRKTTNEEAYAVHRKGPPTLSSVCDDKTLIRAEAAGRPSNWEDHKRSSYAGRRSRRNSVTTADDSQLTIENFGGSQDNLHNIGRNPDKVVGKHVARHPRLVPTEPTLPARSKIQDAYGSGVHLIIADNGHADDDTPPPSRLRRQQSNPNLSHHVSLKNILHSTENENMTENESTSSNTKMASFANLSKSSEKGINLTYMDQEKEDQQSKTSLMSNKKASQSNGNGLTEKKTTFATLPHMTTWQQQSSQQNQQIERSSGDENSVSPVTASTINNLRLKLEEKKRQIENDKRKMEMTMSKRREKVGKAAFLQAVTKGKIKSPSSSTSGGDSPVDMGPLTPMSSGQAGESSIDESSFSVSSSHLPQDKPQRPFSLKEISEDVRDVEHKWLDQNTAPFVETRRTPDIENMDYDQYHQSLTHMNSSISEIQHDIQRLTSQQNQIQQQHLLAQQQQQMQHQQQLQQQLQQLQSLNQHHLNTYGVPSQNPINARVHDPQQGQFYLHDQQPQTQRRTWSQPQPLQLGNDMSGIGYNQSMDSRYISPVYPQDPRIFQDTRSWGIPIQQQKGFILHDTSHEQRYLNGGEHSLSSNQHHMSSYTAAQTLFNQSSSSTASPQHRNAVHRISQLINDSPEVKSVTSRHYLTSDSTVENRLASMPPEDIEPQNISYMANEEELSQGIKNLNITSGNRTYRIPSPTRRSISRNSFQPHTSLRESTPSPSSTNNTAEVVPLDANDVGEKGFYISFDDAPKKPKPSLRTKKASPKKERSVSAYLDQADYVSRYESSPVSATLDRRQVTAQKDLEREKQRQAEEREQLQEELREREQQREMAKERLKERQISENSESRQSSSVGLIIGNQLNNLDPNSIDEMERKKEKIMLLSLQRRQQQEELKDRKEAEIQARREEEKMKEEEKARKKEEEKQRRAQILEKYKIRKAIEEAEREGKVIDKELLNALKPAKLRNKATPSRPRPKTIHVDASSDLDSGVLTPSRGKKGSSSNLSTVSLTSPTMRRDFYRGSQDSLTAAHHYDDRRSSSLYRGSSLRDSPDDGRSSSPTRSSTGLGRRGSYKTSRDMQDPSPQVRGRPKYPSYHFKGRKSSSMMNLCDTDSGLGRATPPRRAASPGMGSMRHLPSPSGPGSLPPGLITKRRMFDDGASDISSTPSSMMDYNGPRLYKQPATKSNRSIMLNAVEYCVFPGTVNREPKQRVLDEISKSDSKHFLILFRDAMCQFRALYSYCPDRDEITKLYGTGPKQVVDKMFDKFFKYNSGGKCFSQVHTKHLTVTIDAFTIHNSLWQGKKVNLPSKKDMALVI